MIANLEPRGVRSDPLNHTGPFVRADHWQIGAGMVAVGHMIVAGAEPSRDHTNEQLTLSGFGQLDLGKTPILRAPQKEPHT